MKTGLLLSGGMDSICIAWWKRPDVAITIDYGQLAAKAELQAAGAVCGRLGIRHEVVTIDCRSLGSGDMAGSQPHDAAPASDWWPYRNQMLITFAAMRGIALGVQRLLIGTVRSDESHRDGTAAFVASIGSLLHLQEGGMDVQAPAIEMSTAELAVASGIPEGLLAWSHSCHKANVPCGECRGCNKYFYTLDKLRDGLDRSGQPTAAR